MQMFEQLKSTLSSLALAIAIGLLLTILFVVLMLRKNNQGNKQVRNKTSSSKKGLITAGILGAGGVTIGSLFLGPTGPYLLVALFLGLTALAFLLIVYFKKLPFISNALAAKEVERKLKQQQDKINRRTERNKKRFSNFFNLFSGFSIKWASPGHTALRFKRKKKQQKATIWFIDPKTGKKKKYKSLPGWDYSQYTVKKNPDGDDVYTAPDGSQYIVHYEDKGTTSTPTSEKESALGPINFW